MQGGILSIYGSDSGQQNMGSAPFSLLSSLPSTTPPFLKTAKNKESRFSTARLTGDLSKCWMRLIWTNQKIWFVTSAIRIHWKGWGGETSSFWRSESLWSFQCCGRRRALELPNLKLEAERESAQWLLEGIILKDRVAVCLSSGALWMYKGAPYQLEQVKDRERVSGWGQPESPLCGVTKVCELSWVQYELWTLVGTEGGFQPRSA